MSFLRNVSSLAINRLACAGLTVSINALSARLLTPGELGSLATAVASVALMMRVASLGLGQSAQYFGARETSDNCFYGRAVLYSTLPITAISLAVLLLAGPLVGRFLLAGDPAAQQLFQVLKYGIPLTCIHFCASLYFLGKREMKRYMWLSLFPLLSSSIVLTWATLEKQGLQAVVFAWMTQYLLSFVVGVVVLVRLGHLPSGSCVQSVLKLYNYGCRSFVVALAAFAVTRINLILGAWFTTSSEVGFFAVGRIFADSLLLVYGAIGPLIFSYVGGMEDPKDFYPFIGRVSRLSLILFSALSFAIAAIAPFGMSLFFGVEYAHKYSIVWMLLPGLVCSTLQHIVENYLYGRGKQMPLALNHIMSIIILGGSSALFAPSLGALGLAMAGTISCLGSLIFTLVIAYRTDRLNPAELVLLRAGDFSFLAQCFSRVGSAYGKRVKYLNRAFFGG